MNERAVARRLAERDDIEPPAGLLEKIQSEIPAEIRVSPELVRSVGGTVEESGMPRRQRWLIAASLVAALGAGVLGWELRQQKGMKEEAAWHDVPTVFDESPPRTQAAPPPPPAAMAAPKEKAAPSPLSRYDASLQRQAMPEAERGRADKLRALGYTSPAAPKPTEPMGVVKEITVEGVAPRLQASQAAASTTYSNEAEALPSTGGNAEPNDRPYGDVFFKTHGTNPFIDTDDDRLSTFGLDVDTGSYTVARRYLADGHLPDPDSVRVEEWVNFFRYGDRPPSRGDFALNAEGAPTPYVEGSRYRLVRFNVRGREIDPRNRKPAVLTFVVDVSGSMDMENRLGLVKKSLGLLLDKLHEGDRIGLVIYGDTGQVLLEPSGDREAVRRAIDRLAPGGSTNAEEGLVLGYDVASRAFREGAINRVILCSDGVANVGNTGPDSILARIGREARRGIELTTLGFGMGNYNDVLMERLADQGDGRYSYIDTLDEARRVLVEELTGTLQTIAKDAKVQVEWNPEMVERYRLLGYENRDIADEKFRDDTVDAGEIGAGHSVTALYEIKLKAGTEEWDRPLGTLHLRWKSADTGKVSEVEKTLRSSDLAPSWEAASPALRLSATVAEFAEILKGSYWAKNGKLDTVFREAQTISPRFAGNADVADLVSLAGKAARLKAEKP
jgi:Ca-activated chloride channel family protein